MSAKRLRPVVVLHALLLLGSSRAWAQRDQHSMAASGPRVRFGAQAIGLLTHVTPAVLGRDLSEGYLTQPTIMGHAAFLGGALELRAMLNLEGQTLRRGELNTGIWGEGYVDRRHPHTYLHEVMGTAAHNFGGLGLSVSAGKGFVPFGTDDPMVRGFVKYPANHHLSQILERLVAIGSVHYGPLALEAGTFNGDEPLAPRSNGTLDRFGDSWSVRGTLVPLSGLELQASRAEVESPELPMGGGLDQRKTNLSARVQREASGAHLYALGEYARTAYVNNGTERFAFTSYLGELSAERSGWRGAVRYEQTVRPEEERRLQGFPFRSVRPPTDFSILGRTRWNIATLQVARAVAHRFGSIQPILEVERSSAETVNKPAVYEPDQFYGDHVIWMLSFGVRVTAGAPHPRMGRYGVAVTESTDTHDMRH